MTSELCRNPYNGRSQHLPSMWLMFTGGTHFLSNWRHFPPTRVIKRIGENTERESLVALPTIGPSNCTAVSYKNCVFFAIGMSNIILHLTELVLKKRSNPSTRPRLASEIAIALVSINQVCLLDF